MSTSTVKADKAEREAQRLALPNMTWYEVSEWLARGVRHFHNGGTRTRFVVGIDAPMVLYKTKSNTLSGHTSGDRLDVFAKWSRGVVINDVWCDKEGKPIAEGDKKS